MTGHNYVELQEKINTILDSIDNWVNQNGLKLNVKKTKYMIFSNRQCSENLNIRLNGVTINRTKCERFLGVLLDDKLSFKQHIAKLATKISINSGIIFKLKGIVPQKVLKLLYDSFIQSHLNFCSNVWGLGSQASIRKIFTAQKKAVRATDIRFNRCYYDKDTGELPCHTRDLFNQHKILTVHNLITKNCLTLMHKTYFDLSPIPIGNFFTKNNSLDRNSRREPEFFVVRRSRLFSLDRTLYMKGPRLYNYVNNKLREQRISLYPEQMVITPYKAIVKTFLQDVHITTLQCPLTTENVTISAEMK